MRKVSPDQEAVYRKRDIDMETMKGKLDRLVADWDEHKVEHQNLSKAIGWNTKITYMALGAISLMGLLTKLGWLVKFGQ